MKNAIIVVLAGGLILVMILGASLTFVSLGTKLTREYDFGYCYLKYEKDPAINGQKIEDVLSFCKLEAGIEKEEENDK